MNGGKGQITVVSLGVCGSEQLTLGASRALHGAEKLVLRTALIPMAEALRGEGLAFADFDALYAQYEDFDELHAQMARRLWAMAEEGPVTFAVIDATSDGAVRMLRNSVPEGGKVTVLPGVSLADMFLAALPCAVDHPGRVRILSASDAAAYAAPDPDSPLLITELWDRMLASEIKLALCETYGDEAEIVFFPGGEEPRRIPLCDMDRMQAYDHTTAVYIPARPIGERSRYCFQDLVNVMHKLRQQDPWDAEQTHESLRKYIIEEACEAVEAIDQDDMEHLAEELGDVLLQVAFHADIGQVVGEFNMHDVTTAIVGKLIHRHPNVFGSMPLATADDVARSWEALKKADRGLKSQGSVLSEVSKALPALMRAAKVQKKAADVGFDWDDAIGALPKIHEEADEVLCDIRAGRNPGEELGDLLFSVVNVARKCGLEPELLLKSATDKFVRRFTAMENLIISDEKSLEGLTLAEMDVYWYRVKLSEQKSR